VRKLDIGTGDEEKEISRGNFVRLVIRSTDQGERKRVASPSACSLEDMGERMGGRRKMFCEILGEWEGPCASYGSA